jgi:UDP-GlcNAc:undecaprenyl-phosphate GlcNAc-1-phosphate transferase
MVAALAGALLVPAGFLPQALSAFLAEHRPGIVKEWIALAGLMAGGAVIFAGGLLDDRKNLSPRAKLVWQIAASMIAIASGYRLDFYKVLWNHPAGEYLLAVPGTLFWMLFLINAFNLLDNMDGLSAGVAAITTSFFGIYAHWQGEFFLAASMSCLVGALLGFLRYNWNPSRIFMGDGGALLVGFLIAGFTCRCTYYQMTPRTVVSWVLNGGQFQAQQGLLSLLTPLVIMAVPIFDTTTVVFIRWKNRKPLMVGDTNHFSHRLVALGLTHKHAVQVIYLATTFTGLGALVLQSASATQAVLIFLQVLSVFAMITVLESRQRRNRGPEG